MNELEDERVLAQLEGIHELLEVLVSCMGGDKACCAEGECNCKEE